MIGSIVPVKIRVIPIRYEEKMWEVPIRRIEARARGKRYIRRYVCRRARHVSRRCVRCHACQADSLLPRKTDGLRQPTSGSSRQMRVFHVNAGDAPQPLHGRLVAPCAGGASPAFVRPAYPPAFVSIAQDSQLRRQISCVLAANMIPYGSAQALIV